MSQSLGESGNTAMVVLPVRMIVRRPWTIVGLGRLSALDNCLNLNPDLHLSGIFLALIE
jgi:hypothetical protein